MSVPKLRRVATKAKSLKKTNLYRDFYFAFLVLLLLTGLFSSQSVSAASGEYQSFSVYKAGYFYQQEKANFLEAKRAFDNQDYVYSARLLAVLAENGHVQSQYLLATQYDAGLGVAKNANSSFHWYKKAARAGVDIAQHNVAVAYAQGHGVEADLDKAITWWKRAANAGNTDSQYNLGIIYAAGRESVKPDIEKAIKWWRMAAIGGDAVAQFNLGALYANGIGMSSRTCEASRWWKRSAANGFAQAEMALAILETKHDYSICK